MAVIKDDFQAISKNELLELFRLEKSMCKISVETSENKKFGSGFFVEIDNFPIKHALFTSNYVLNESDIKIGKTIHFQYLEKNMQIEIIENRKALTNKELNYTCIELFETDGITKDYFKIDPNLFKHNNKYLENNDIFILQFPDGNELSFSNGKILSLEGNIIKHRAPTSNGSAGSPIIRRSKENYIIGLHCGYVEKENKYQYNYGITFDSILDDIKQLFSNEINCIYISDKDGKEINLLHDYNENISKWPEEYQKLYLDAKNKNKKIFEENIDLYVNGIKVKFDYKYKIKESKEIQVKFKFNKKLTNAGYMFAFCSSLKEIDLSSFNTTSITNMSGMFTFCSSLRSINLSSFNTTNVTNMNHMFFNCSSLISIDLSSFNTINVSDMSNMFAGCSSLGAIDISSFNTANVNNMSNMFSYCSSLTSINLMSFNTINVKSMSGMFFNCPSLKTIDISSFDTTNVKDMSNMFSYCSCLESIKTSSFNTKNVNDISNMFTGCFSLKKDNIKFNK